MAKFALIPFNPASAPAIEIHSELNTTEESVYISYKVTGDLSSLDLGSGRSLHNRVIKLWEKSCFELFIKDASDSYVEFNFSPEFEWNAFYFAKKGDALKEYEKVNQVKTDILLSQDVFHIIVEIEKNKFPENFFTGELSAGITSVVKEKNGNISYWALSHEDTKPNFHDFRSFRYKF